MTPFVKHLLISLGILTVAYAVYYMYAQQAALSGGSNAEAEVLYNNMKRDTEVFIMRSQELDRMSLDMAVLDDARFQSLRAFTKPVEDRSYGRTNPFAAPESGYVISGE